MPGESREEQAVAAQRKRKVTGDTTQVGQVWAAGRTPPRPGSGPEARGLGPRQTGLPRCRSPGGRLGVRRGTRSSRGHSQVPRSHQQWTRGVGP